MPGREVALQPLLCRRAEQLGDIGAAWLAGLPDLIADLERQWSVTIGEPLRGGTAAYVARAQTSSGADVVVKLGLPDREFARQVRTIDAAAGRGYVRLIGHDVKRHAMLLEALGPSLDQVGLAPEAQIETLCMMLRQAWAVPNGVGLHAEPPHDKARGLHELVGRLWEDLDHPCEERIVARALAFADRRAAAFDPERCVIVHGDPAPPNALRVLEPRAGAAAGYVFVDPDGFLGDPDYDLGVVLRDWCSQLLAGDPPTLARCYCRLLAHHTGMDETAIWEWGFLERVSTGLYALSFGAEDLARPFLATAAALM